MRLLHRSIVALVAAPLLLLAGCGDDTPDGSTAASATPRDPASQQKDDPERRKETPTPEFDVRLEVLEKSNVALELRWRMQFPVVSGLPDRSVEQRVNELLRAVPEEFLDGVEQTVADNQQSLAPASHRTLLQSNAEIGLRGPRLLSVRYTFTANEGLLGRVEEPTVPLTVDLTTGREMTAEDLLSDRVRTPEGAREFERLLTEFGPGGNLCGQEVVGVREMRPDDLVADDPQDSVVSLFPGKKEVSFALALWDLGYPMSCLGTTIDVPYDDLEGFLSPDLIEAHQAAVDQKRPR